MVKKIIVIFVVALVLRFWAISTQPSSLSMDEIAVGVDANFILKTGRDQHGEVLPLAFRSVGDYKSPVAIYLTVPSVSIFGLNEFAVRLPAALLGTLTAVVFLFLLIELGLSGGGAFLGGLWLALNPWHVYLSRTSFDGIIALFFVILGLTAFLRAEKKKSVRGFALSAALLALAAWSYHAERVFVPILTLLILLYFKPKKLLLPALVVFAFGLPFVYTALVGQGIFARAADLWVGKDPGATWIGQYLNYFDLNLWFAKGLNLTPPKYPDSGLLYFVDLPLFLIGSYALFKSKNKFLKILTLFWFLIGPLPASLTRGGINPGRTIIWLPFFGLVMAVGFESLLAHKKRFLLLLYGLLVAWNLGYFWNLYKYNFPKFYADLWHWGYKEVAEYSCRNRDRYKKIIITDKYGIEWPSVKTIPYLYVLFYCKWDPQVYLKDKNLGNIEFRQPQWRIDSRENNWLLIGSRWDFPEDFDKSKIMKTIYFPASAYEPKPAFYFVETTPR